jgi:hypothetical protein
MTRTIGGSIVPAIGRDKTLERCVRGIETRMEVMTTRGLGYNRKDKFLRKSTECAWTDEHDRLLVRCSTKLWPPSPMHPRGVT